MKLKTIRSQTSRSESGQTIILVAVSMVTLLAMAALAIDVVSLYVAATRFSGQRMRRRWLVRRQLPILA